MSAADAIRWDHLPAPDFSAVGKWFYRFPAELRKLFNRSEENVMIGVLFFSWVAGHRAGRQTNYCSFSQEKLGEKFGRSRWTVARALDSLEHMDFIKRVHRRPKPGETWQTNLYILTPKLLRLLQAVFKGIYKKIPCSKTAPQVAIKDTKREGLDSSSKESESVPLKKGDSDDVQPYTGPSLTDLFLQFRGQKTM